MSAAPRRCSWPGITNWWAGRCASSRSFAIQPRTSDANAISRARGCWTSFARCSRFERRKVMFVLEALRAKHGDALLLHYGTKTAPRLAVIDAGPGGVFADAVRPRLMQIREERGLSEDEPLEIDLMMVSHLDADHITGILELMRKLRDLRQSRKPVPWTISRFWHNAFDDLTGGGATTASTNSSLSTASIGEFLNIEGSNILASVGQGRELRDLVKFFDLDGNP